MHSTGLCEFPFTVTMNDAREMTARVQSWNGSSFADPEWNSEYPASRGISGGSSGGTWSDSLYCWHESVSDYGASGFLVYRMDFDYTMPDGSKGTKSFGPSVIYRGSFINDTSYDIWPEYMEEDGPVELSAFFYINYDVDISKIELTNATLTNTTTGETLTPREVHFELQDTDDHRRAIYSCEFDGRPGCVYELDVSMTYSDSVGGANVRWPSTGSLSFDT